MANEIQVKTKQDRLQALYSEHEMTLTKLDVHLQFLQEEKKSVETRALVDPTLPRNIVSEISAAIERVTNNIDDLKKQQFIIVQMFEAI